MSTRSSATNEDDKCPICLIPPIIKTRPDVCQHSFCCQCLVNWKFVSQLNT